MSTSPPGVLLCNLKATFSFRRFFFSFSLKDYVRSSLYRDGEGGGGWGGSVKVEDLKLLTKQKKEKEKMKRKRKGCRT